ncbi:MAG: hypothetical protein PUB76_05555 [Oscillospiraceae bacterium]|nr:hypothetical protein [Oscillospiraceae bacterium]MDD6085422.1 hypothetical protein [Oscillospiraceae bacterium]
MENTYKKRNFVYEMANLKSEKTGQPFELWIDELGKIEFNLIIVPNLN